MGPAGQPCVAELACAQGRGLGSAWPFLPHRLAAPLLPLLPPLDPIAPLQKEKNHILFDNALFHMRQMDFVPVTAFPQLCTKEVRRGVGTCVGGMRRADRKAVAAQQARSVRALGCCRYVC